MSNVINIRDHIDHGFVKVRKPDGTIVYIKATNIRKELAK